MSLVTRIVVALLLVVSATLGLHFGIERGARAEVRPPAPPRPAPSAWPVDVPIGSPSRLWIATDAAALPGNVGPVVQVGSEGQLRVLVGAPRPDELGPTVRWLSGAILVPSGPPGAWSARCRGRVLELLVRWDAFDPALGIVPVGAFAADDWARLRRWRSR